MKALRLAVAVAVVAVLIGASACRKQVPMPTGPAVLEQSPAPVVEDTSGAPVGRP